MQAFDNIIKVIKLTHEFQKVKRVVHTVGEEGYENDVEHSYSLALLSWYIISSEKLNFDIQRVIQYALMHDLVEVYAGDTFIYDPDPEVISSKPQREADAADRLRKEFPEFSEMHELIDVYTQRIDDEAKFVYALDKILPMLNIYLDKGRTWQEKGTTLKMLVEHKTDKVAVSPEIKPYFDYLVKILSENEQELFHSQTYEKRASI